MARKNSENGSSTEQVKQAKKNAALSDGHSASEPYDKKLDGPNRPSI